MEAPLYLLTETDGIPIPDTTWILDIPHDTQKLNKENNQVILAIANHDDIDLLLDDVKQCAIYTQKIGVLCRVVAEEDTDVFKAVTLEVECRVYLEAFSSVENSKQIVVEYTPVSEELLPEEEGQMAEQFNELVKLIKSSPNVFGKNLALAISHETWLPTQMNLIANTLLREPAERAKYLQEELNLKRFETLLKVAANWKPRKEKETSAKKNKRQRIHNADSIKARFSKLEVDPEVKYHLEREVQKLNSLSKTSTEHSMVLDYMSWVLDIPWGKYSRQEPNLSELIATLGQTHYGLDEVKQHVLEHMTIEKIKGGSTGSVMCFVGTPGTGKTSIAKQIAAASNRHLARVALGGLSDEAEIRGHRRTYIGSRPGRLIVGLRQAGTLDPLFLLDEIDKISNGGRGDPSAALLEVLDREQNDHFIDRYLEIPVDLTRAMIVCTANYEEQIPEALRDRMEFIYFPKYKRDERLIIITEHLIPKARKQLSLTDYPIVIAAEAVEELADYEQIRVIEKKIHKLMRMAAVDIVVDKQDNIRVDTKYMRRLPTTKNHRKSIGFKF